MHKENHNKPYRTILMGNCDCSKLPTEQRYVKNVGEHDIRKCDECDAEILWPAYVYVSNYSGEPGL